MMFKRLNTNWFCLFLYKKIVAKAKAAETKNNAPQGIKSKAKVAAPSALDIKGINSGNTAEKTAVKARYKV